MRLCVVVFGHKMLHQQPDPVLSTAGTRVVVKQDNVFCSSGGNHQEYLACLAL